MARQTSFGDILADARERKGMDVSTAARKLRIRPDILRAIEDGDFARMPPRGYTSNMVGAYARLVGLNPAEMTRAYREEAHQFETGRRSALGRPESRGLTMPSSRSANRSSRTDRTADRGSRLGYGSGYGASTRGNRGVSSQPQYTNLVQGRQAPGLINSLGSLLPLIIVGAIIVLLLVLVIVLAFGNRSAPDADTPTVPISGLPNPAGTDTGATQSNTNTDNTTTQQNTPTVSQVAPTSAQFSYSVEEGKKVYIEIIQDDKTTEAGDVSGPKTAEFNVTGKLKFVMTGDPEDVNITVDGQAVTPVDQNGRGVYTYTVNFEDVLNQWRQANGLSASSNTGEGENANSTTSDGGTTNDTASDTTSSSDE